MVREVSIGFQPWLWLCSLDRPGEILAPGPQFPYLYSKGLDGMISQAPSSPALSALSYNSLDMASLFKGKKCLLVKQLRGQEEFLAVVPFPPANSGF